MKITWFKGPPPHIGWWNASNNCNRGAWRWWDGTFWSFPYSPDTPSIDAHPEHDIYSHPAIHWNHTYPENARVPRINPGKSNEKQ